MVEIKDTLVSFDIFTECFCCDLKACRGACCVEGDAGPPLDIDEIADMEEVAELLEDELSDEAKKVIDDEGVAYIDPEGQMVANIVNGKDCIFATDDGNGCTICSVDRAFREGRTSIQKPLSCELYPIRLGKVGGMTAVNFHKWDICKDACKLGKELQMPAFRFLKKPLIRAFGQEWWDECELVYSELKKQGYI